MRHQHPSPATAPRHSGLRRGHARSARHARAVAIAAACRPDRRAGARARASVEPVADPVVLGAATWLACGIVLLGLTPLPLRDPQLGWSFSFWTLAAPVLLLLGRFACGRAAASPRGNRRQRLQ